MTASAEEARITLYALGLTKIVTESFTKLSNMTGGEYFEAGQGEKAIERLKAILVSEFGNLDFDQRVLAEHQAHPEASIDDVVDRLESSRPAVSAALSRLGARGLLTWASTTC